jgi:malate dehydrogenase (oxaloacetate-decarboxylating)(NADP+)
MSIVPMAVAKAAIQSGVATRPIKDWGTYESKLKGFTNRTALAMKPLLELATKSKKRIIFAEGEETLVLRAVQIIVEEGIAKPILVGRRAVISKRIEKSKLNLIEGRDYTLVDPENDERYNDYWTSYHKMVERGGLTPADAKATMRTNPTVIASMLLEKGEGDAMICGVVRKYHFHLQHVRKIIRLRDGVRVPAAMFMLILPNHETLFVCDTHVNYDPSAEDLADITLMAAEQVRRFGIEPKVALVSHSNFGSHSTASAIKMRETLKLLREAAPELEVDGEMHADTALDQEIRDRIFPGSTLKGQANLLVMPNVDAANIAYNLLKVTGDAVPVGPMLLGMRKPVHIVTSATRVQGLVNMTAQAVAHADDVTAPVKKGGLWSKLKR